METIAAGVQQLCEMQAWRPAGVDWAILEEITSLRSDMDG